MKLVERVVSGSANEIRNWLKEEFSKVRIK